MGLQINWAPEVLQALKVHAPAGGERWLNVTDAALLSGVGLGMAAINLKGAVRQGYALVRNSSEAQLEYQATERIGEFASRPMYDTARPGKGGLG